MTTHNCPTCGAEGTVEFLVEEVPGFAGAGLGGWGCGDCGAEFDWPAPNDAAALVKRLLGLDQADDWSRVERAIYKGTDCGAWISLDSFDQITVGSIVEGADVGCTPITLVAPFDAADFDAALEQIEDQAEEIWLEWNHDDSEE